MATITKKRYQDGQRFGSAPYGNVTALEYPIVTNAAGAFVNSDTAAAIASGDVVRLGVLPAGFRLHDSLTLVSTAFTASVVGSIGFAYVDGVDSTDVPQDADYFGAAVANTAGRYRASNTAVKPVTLPKDAWLTITTGGANNAKAADATVIVIGELVGIGE
jgi:hypothetical protein